MKQTYSALVVITETRHLRLRMRADDKDGAVDAAKTFAEGNPNIVRTISTPDARDFTCAASDCLEIVGDDGRVDVEA